MQPVGLKTINKPTSGSKPIVSGQGEEVLFRNEFCLWCRDEHEVKSGVKSPTIQSMLPIHQSTTIHSLVHKHLKSLLLLLLLYYILTLHQGFLKLKDTKDTFCFSQQAA